jgi:hypothetical protein
MRIPAMNRKDEIADVLEEFYAEMKQAQLLEYASCRLRDEAQEKLVNKYADAINKLK